MAIFVEKSGILLFQDISTFFLSDTLTGAESTYDVPKSNLPVKEIARSVSVSLNQLHKQSARSGRANSFPRGKM